MGPKNNYVPVYKTDKRRRRRRGAKTGWMDLMGGKKNVSDLLDESGELVNNGNEGQHLEPTEVVSVDKIVPDAQHSHTTTECPITVKETNLPSVPPCDDRPSWSQPDQTEEDDEPICEESHGNAHENTPTSPANGHFMTDGDVNEHYVVPPPFEAPTGDDVDVHIDMADDEAMELDPVCQDLPLQDYVTEGEPDADPESGNGHGTTTVATQEELSPRANLPKLQSTLLRMMRWQTMYAIVATTGRVRLTVREYEFFADTIHALRPDITIPCHRTIQEYRTKYLIKNCFPASVIVPLPCVSAPTVDTNLSTSAQIRNRRSVRIILPSEWACYDIRTLPYLRDMMNAPNKDLTSIANAPICKYREDILDLERQVQVSDQTGYGRGRPGDVLQFRTKNCPAMIDGTESCALGWKVITEGLEWSGSSTDVAVEASLGAVWLVSADQPTSGSVSNICDTQLGHSCTAEERQLLSQLSGGKCEGVVYDDEISNRTSSWPRRGRFGRGRSRGRTASRRQQTSQTITEAGDICAFLKPTGTIAGETLHDAGVNSWCVYVCRFRPGPTGTDRERILWLQGNTSADDSATLHGSVRILAQCTVTDIPVLFRRGSSTGERRSPTNPSKHFGTLQDGTPYIVYPIILYHDDFNPSQQLFPNSSVGGCYIMPMGFTQEMRLSATAARIISLTPPGMKTMEVLKYIMSDIIQASTEGKLTTDAYGRKVRVFLDPIGFVSDYPAASAVLDVKSHAAEVPCTLCSFPRKKNQLSGAYSYTSKVNSSRSGYVRFAGRARAVRDVGINDDDGMRMGMLPGGRELLEQSPLFILHEGLRNASHLIPLTDKGVKVVSGLFDPYVNSMVAPDHALMGISRNILDLFLEVLPDHTVRCQAEMQICTYQKTHGLPLQSSIYSTRTKTLNSMSMTSVFSILLIVSRCADLYLNDEGPQGDCKRLISTLQQMISRGYCSPNPSVDGPIALQYSGEKGKHHLNMELQEMVTRYIQQVNEFIRKYRDLGRILDKPNLHRIVELFMHSIPLFGHMRNFGEMVLEGVHQILKGGLLGNTHCDAHITAVEHALSRDWQQRLFDIVRLAKRKDKDAPHGNLGLIRFLLGERVMMLNNDERAELLTTADSGLIDLLKEPLRTYMEKNTRPICEGLDRVRVWYGRGKVGSPYVDDVREGMNLLRMYNEGSGTTASGCMREYSHAAFGYQDGHSAGRRSYSHARLTYDTVLSAVVRIGKERERIVEVAGTEEDVRLRQFAVGGVVGWTTEDEVWAVCKLMVLVDEASQLWVTEAPIGVQVQLIKLTGHARRVAAFHSCSQACSFNDEQKLFNHTPKIYAGGHFRLAGRHDGFPPRMT